MSMGRKLDRRQFLKASATVAAAAAMGGSAARSFAAADTVYIAVPAPMTGDAAAFGLNAKRGAEAAVATINAAGGIAGKQVAFDSFDDQGLPREAASVARRILDADKYIAVVGHVNSSCTLAGMPIYSEAGMPVMNAVSSNPKITGSGWSNLVRLVIRDDYGAQQNSAFAVNNLGKKKIGILFANDDYGRGLRDQMMEAFDALQAQVVGEAAFTPNADKDFSSIISSFKANGVDVFMLNCNYTEGGLFLGQAKAAGVTDIPVVGLDSLLFKDFIDLAQGGAEGAYILANYDPFATAPLSKEFFDAYKKSYSSVPDPVSTLTHDSILLIKQLVEAGATSETLIASAKAARFEGAAGHFEWNENGDVKNRTRPVVQVKNGTFTSTGISVDETGLEKLRG